MYFANCSTAQSPYSSGSVSARAVLSDPRVVALRAEEALRDSPAAYGLSHPISWPSRLDLASESPPPAP